MAPSMFKAGRVSSYFVGGIILASGYVFGDEPLDLRYPVRIAAQAEPLPLPDPDHVSVAAEPIRLLTLCELEEMALAANPSVQRFWSLVQAAKANALQVGLYPNPSVGYEGQQLGSGGLAEQHGALFTQEIIRGGKLSLNRAVASREVMQLEQQLAAQQQRVLTDVRISYYDVLLAQRQIQLTDDLIRIGEEGSKSVDALFRATEVGKVDILQAQLEIENAKILSENAQNRYFSAWRNLSAVVGDETLAPQALAGELTGEPRDYSFDDALARLQQLSPEVAAAAIEVERACLVYRRAQVEPVPNVNVQGLVNWRDNGIGGDPDGGLAVSIPIPIFDKNQGAIARANHEVIAARQALAQLNLELQQRLAPVFEQYSNARNQVGRYENTILPAAQESLDLTRQSYRTGESNYIALLTVQRTYSQTQLNHLEALRTLRVTEAEIDGLLLRDSLRNSAAGISTPNQPTIQNSTGLLDFRGR